MEIESMGKPSQFFIFSILWLFDSLCLSYGTILILHTAAGIPSNGSLRLYDKFINLLLLFLRNRLYYLFSLLSFFVSSPYYSNFQTLCCTYCHYFCSFFFLSFYFIFYICYLGICFDFALYILLVSILLPSTQLSVKSYIVFSFSDALVSLDYSLSLFFKLTKRPFLYFADELWIKGDAFSYSGSSKIIKVFGGLNTVIKSIEVEFFALYSDIIFLNFWKGKPVMAPSLFNLWWSLIREIKVSSLTLRNSKRLKLNCSKLNLTNSFWHLFYS